jgi:hypothetical protein
MARLSGSPFFLPEDPLYTISDSMRDSVNFVVNCCLTEYNPTFTIYPLDLSHVKI